MIKIRLEQGGGFAPEMQVEDGDRGVIRLGAKALRELADLLGPWRTR